MRGVTSILPPQDSRRGLKLDLTYVPCALGVIVQTNKDGSLPPHVLYKIRQNSSFTEKTNEIRRAYWRPGPNTGGKFYFLYGFVWIQGRRRLPGCRITTDESSLNM